MELVNNEVSVEILIDINDSDKCLPPCSKNEKINLESAKIEKELKTELQLSSIEKCISFSNCSKKGETILDMSPTRICEEFSDENITASEINLQKSLKSEISNGCPIALLVDVSPPTRFCFRDNCVSKTCLSHTKEVGIYKKPNIRNQDSKNKMDASSIIAAGCSKTTKDSDYFSNSSELQCQVPGKRLRWKTPSPKSMSRINKEASKVIDNLNSSSIFDEDFLLTEEILPIPFSFDELDDDTYQKHSSDTVVKDVIFNEPLLSELSLNKINLNSHSSSKTESFEKVKSKLLIIETTVIDESHKISSKSDSNSMQSYSSESNINSFDNLESLTCCDEVDDVFNATLDSEDKENLQNKNNKENKIRNKTPAKNLSVNRSKFEQRDTLRNLSNIKTEASAKRLSLSVNKNITTPLKRMNTSTNKKSTLNHVQKPKMKKSTLSVESHSSLKAAQTKSSQFLNRDFSVPKPLPTIKIDSGCSSVASGLKQQNFGTPSRRYSICTPLKSASSIKAPLTPAMSSSHNFAYPRYTPQPARPSRLSFSSSWQQSSNNSQLFPGKRLKQQTSATMPSSASKSASTNKCFSKPVKVSFSQSMSAVPGQSFGKNPSNKGKFYSKLHSPLSHDKKVARALFTSVSNN